MKTDKVLYAIRMPIDLKRLLDTAARSGGVSTTQLVVDALWRYLDPNAKQATSTIPAFTAEDAIEVFGPVEPLPARMNPTMEKFMQSQFKVNTAPVPASGWIVDHEQIAELEKRSCSECDATMADKYIKGRGTVYACNDVSCPMYGRDTK